MENPLLRSGLVLAGANTWLAGKAESPEAANGILTAEDASGLDLLFTDLVVLSACQTGLGDIKVGEGVFGLRRAFLLAGAKTLLMSLWKIPDEETQMLMEDFYKRILEGKPRADALREAQLAVRAVSPEPLFWGAFICQGDPGPLGAAPRQNK
jgi:CHAT domain-containing protein